MSAAPARDEPPAIESRRRLGPALERLRFSRRTTEAFLSDVSPDEFFWLPGEGLNPLGWHVGHLAFAEYFLCLKRVRDRLESDLELIPTLFLKRYKFGSKSSGDPAKNATPEELLATLQGVHELALAELAPRTDAELDTPTSPPHPFFDTKLGAIEWCSQHELLHCGQIMLLRRLLGKPAVWA